MEDISLESQEVNLPVDLHELMGHVLNDETIPADFRANLSAHFEAICGDEDQLIAFAEELNANYGHRYQEAA